MTRLSALRPLTLLAASVSGAVLAGTSAASAGYGMSRASDDLRVRPHLTVDHGMRGEDTATNNCLRTRDWCEVATGEFGWFPDRSIVVFGEGGRAIVTDPDAPAFDLPILSFGMPEYWHGVDKAFSGEVDPGSPSGNAREHGVWSSPRIP